MPAPHEYPELTFRELGDLVAARTPAPGGGSVAALALALAAGLVAMAARFSDERWKGAPAVAERAEALRAEAMLLAGEDAAAYSGVLEARRAPTAGEERRRRVEEANALAADVPLRIGRVAAEVAELAAAAVKHGNPNLEGDAAAGAVLAEGAARIGSRLVEINLGSLGPGDERIVKARQFAAVAAAAAGSATGRA